MLRPARAFLLIGIAGLTACASAPRTASEPEVTVRRADRNLITADEIATSGAITARQAVERLRPHMLSRQSVTSIRGGNADQLQVYIDNQRHGGIDQLANIQAPEIQEIRYMSGVDATNRYGTGHSAGVILVIRKRR
jgi:hypothetical protein